MNDKTILNVEVIFSTVIDIIKTFLPAFIAFWTIRKSYQYNRDLRNEDNARKLLEDKIENLYFPVYCIHLSEMYPREKQYIIKVDCGDISFLLESARKIDEIVLKNIKYASRNSQELFINFHAAMLSRFTYELELLPNQSFISDEMLINHIESISITYNNLCSSLFNEYKEICKKLGFSEPLDFI